jgi:GNAT superfamily N-acetyltransferase
LVYLRGMSERPIGSRQAVETAAGVDICALAPGSLADPELAALYLAYLAEFGVLRSFAPYPALFARLIGEGWIEGVTAHLGERWVGFCVYTRTYSSLLPAPAYSIEDLFVAAEHRRRRIGTALINGVVMHARGIGVGRIFVHTDASASLMHGFYAANGFVDADAVRLRREVTDAD